MLNISNQEIKYNLGILENTIKKIENPSFDSGVKYKKDEKIEIDPEFLKIFEKAITENAKNAKDEISMKEITELKNKLAEIKLKVQEIAHERVYSKPQENEENELNTALMGPESSLAELAEIQEKDVLKAGYKKLDEQYSYHPILGEGHCLFRSIAAGILHNYSNMNKTEGKAFFAKLGHTMDKYKDSRFIKRDDATRLYGILERAKEGWQGVMQTREDSDWMVGFLRRLACAHNDKDEEFSKFLAENEYDTKEAYFNDMVSIEKGEFGGNAEIAALVKSLGMGMRILLVEQIGKGYEFGGELEGPAINLLYTSSPGHYDLAIEK